MFYANFWGWLAVFVVCFACVDSRNDPECFNFTLPGCSCAWLGNIFGITCTGMADVLSLPKLLDSSFGVQTTYEITLKNFPHIPPGVIEDLIIYRFIVDGTETDDFSQNLFDGVKRLRWFHVYLSSLTRIPNFSNISHSLSRVNIDNSLLSKIDDEFQNLPLLRRLSLRNNSLEYIRIDAFNGTTGIQFVDLSYNRLRSLPESIFDELTELIKLDLSCNRLHTVHGLFKNLGTKLKYLSLGFNNLSNADDVLQFRMSRLESLWLNNNPLRKLSVNTFNATVPSLRLLSLSHCNLTEFRAEYFRELWLLRLLDLSFNQIKHVGNEDMTSGNDLELIMIGNKIKDFDGRTAYRIKKLFLSENSLGNMITCTKLSEVDVSLNRLEALEKIDFADAYKLEVVHFRYNLIRRIDMQCFESAENSLLDLDLRGNFLTSLNRSLQFLSVLKILDISNNLLETLDYEELKGLNELSLLNLQTNRIVTLSGKAQNLPNLQYLILKNNRISQLNMQNIPRTLQYMDIKENPLKCNCQLYKNFLSRLEKRLLHLDTTPCTQTNASEYRPCPSPCSCYCSVSGTSWAISVNCSSRHMTGVPAELSEERPPFSSDERSYRIDDFSFAIYDRIVSVDVSNNNIKSLEDVYFSRNLKKLYLSNNRLKTLPYDIMNLPELQEMTLSGNKWRCNCDEGKAIEFRNWLLPEDRHVADINKTLCYNFPEKRAIVAISEKEICPRNVTVYVLCGLLMLGFFVLIFALTIIYTRYKFNVKTWLCAKGAVRPYSGDVGLNTNLNAFISFSNADRDFVTEQIVPEIAARCPDINIFCEGIHLYEDLMKERKLQPPSPLENKITVIIVTRNFLEDQSCLSVMNIHKEEHDEFHPMMVIKVGDLASDWEKSVRTFVPNATYLEWGNKYFWDNLINSLPQTVDLTSGNDRNFPLLVTTEI